MIAPPLSVGFERVDRLARALELLGLGYPERTLMRLAEALGGAAARRRSGAFREPLAAARGSWTTASLRLQSAIALCELAAARRPALVLELGTGYSTLLLGTFARGAPGGPFAIVSVEHDARWHAAQRARLVQAAVEVELVLAPLVDVAAGAEYDREIVQDALAGRVPELILVDGPVGSRHGGPGRRGSLAQAIELAPPGGIVLLHDALRDEEFALVRQAVASGAVHADGLVLDADGLIVLRKP